MKHRGQQRSVFLSLVLVGAMSTALSACGGGGGNASAPQPAASAPSAGSVPAAPSLPGQGSGSAELAWTAPTENADGTALTNLAGYTLVYGTSESELTQTVNIDNPSITTYVVSELPAGSYYFAVKARNATGAESDFSNVMSKAIG